MKQKTYIFILLFVLIVGLVFYNSENLFKNIVKNDPNGYFNMPKEKPLLSIESGQFSYMAEIKLKKLNNENVKVTITK